MNWSLPTTVNDLTIVYFGEEEKTIALDDYLSRDDWFSLYSWNTATTRDSWAYSTFRKRWSFDSYFAKTNWTKFTKHSEPPPPPHNTILFIEQVFSITIRLILLLWFVAMLGILAQCVSTCSPTRPIAYIHRNDWQWTSKGQWTLMTQLVEYYQLIITASLSS